MAAKAGGFAGLLEVGISNRINQGVHHIDIEVNSIERLGTSFLLMFPAGPASQHQARLGRQASMTYHVRIMLGRYSCGRMRQA